MAFRTVTRSILLSAAWRSSLSHHPTDLPSSPSLPFLASRVTVWASRGAAPLRFSHGNAPWLGALFFPPRDKGDPCKDAVSEVPKPEGRVVRSTDVAKGCIVTDDDIDEWLVLDQKVNRYPMVRGFIAIGTGGDDFVQAMVVAVESVIRYPILEEQVNQRLSSRGKYVSVNIGPIEVVSGKQVVAVYNAMRRDDRTKFFL